ncbi:TniQ family protein [Novosphingobium terrae]|uniref:TniQ family protein n=1 Tax=Novosphingobium terrae TaxID=2726189 RepID=UPI001981EDAC|nr:TniQ family protein [Novosphingobium terrae]
MGSDDDFGAERTPFGQYVRQVGAGLSSQRPPAPAPSREGWSRLRKEVAPRPGESLRGLVYRCCAINDLHNSWSILKSLGLRYRNQVMISEDPNIELEQLAHAIGVEDGEVIGRCYPGLGNSHRSFYGLRLGRGAVEWSLRRFSPLAFRADREAAVRAAESSGRQSIDRDHGYHRATWELADIPFCVDHWDMLHDACPCETGDVPQRWTRTVTQLHDCDRCGNSLADLRSYPVPEDMRKALTLIKALVHPIEAERESALDALPPALRQVDRNQIYSVFMQLVEVFDPDAVNYPIERARDRLNGLWKAADYLQRWPNSHDELAFRPGTSANSILSTSRALKRLAQAANLKLGDPRRLLPSTRTAAKDAPKSSSNLGWGIDGAVDGLEASIVPDHMWPALSIISALAHPADEIRISAIGALPPALRHVDRDLTFDILKQLAGVFSPPTPSDQIAAPQDRLQGLWKAADILHRWPASLEDMVFDASVRPSTMIKINRALNDFGWAVARSKPSDSPHRGLPVIHMPPAGQGNPISKVEALGVSKLASETLELAWDEGLVTRLLRLHGRRLVRAYAAAEVQSLGEEWNSRITPDSLAYDLGISYHGVEQLTALGILEADGPAFAGTGPHFMPGTVDDFFSRLEEQASRNRLMVPHPMEDPVRLVDAMRHVWGRPKPWGPVFRQLLDGDLHFEISPGTQVADSVLIASSSIPAVQAARFERSRFPATFSPYLIRRDALVLLNINPKRYSVALQKLPVCGQFSNLYLVDDVEDLARRWISLREIATRLNMPATTAAKALRAADLQEIRRKIWDRIDVEEHFGWA